MSCKACGYKGHIAAMSKSEGKMESYIIKNPIDDSASSVGGKKSGKKGRKAHEKKQRKSPDDERTPESPASTANKDDDNSSEEWTENVSTISEKLKNSAVSNVTSLIQDETVSQQTLQQRTNTFLELAKDIYEQNGISGLRGSVAFLKNESGE